MRTKHRAIEKRKEVLTLNRARRVYSYRRIAIRSARRSNLQYEQKKQYTCAHGNKSAATCAQFQAKVCASLTGTRNFEKFSQRETFFSSVKGSSHKTTLTLKVRHLECCAGTGCRLERAPPPNSTGIAGPPPVAGPAIPVALQGMPPPAIVATYG
jgi:hypothetical protein